MTSSQGVSAAGVTLAGAGAPARALAELAQLARAVTPVLGAAEPLADLAVAGASALTRATLDDAQARAAAALARLAAPSVEQPTDAGPRRAAHRPGPAAQVPRPRTASPRTTSARALAGVPTPSAAEAAMTRIVTTLGAALGLERSRPSAIARPGKRPGRSPRKPVLSATTDRTLDEGRDPLPAPALATSGLAAFADRVSGGRNAAALTVAPSPIIAAPVAAPASSPTVSPLSEPSASPAAALAAPALAASPVPARTTPSPRPAETTGRLATPSRATPAPVASRRSGGTAPGAPPAGDPRIAPALSSATRPPPSPPAGPHIAAPVPRTDEAPAPRGLARLVSLWQREAPVAAPPSPEPPDDASIEGLGADEAITRALDRVLRQEARRHGIWVNEW